MSWTAIIPFPRRRVPGQAFSLVELLAVMAIIVLMLSLLAPAVSSFNSTAGRRGAVNVLMNTLEQARVAALTGGRDVYVLFRRSRFPARDAIMVVQDLDSDPTTNQERYEALSRWIQLPKGVLIYDAKAGNVMKQSFPAGGFDVAKFPGKLDSTNGDQFNVITFNSFGGITFPSNDLMLFVSEGVRGDNGTEALIGARKEQSTGLEIITLRRFTGRASLEASTL